MANLIRRGAIKEAPQIEGRADPVRPRRRGARLAAFAAGGQPDGSRDPPDPFRKAGISFDQY